MGTDGLLYRPVSTWSSMSSAATSRSVPRAWSWPEVRPAEVWAVDFVVASDRVQPGEVAQRVRGGRPRTNIGRIAALDDAVAAFNPIERTKGEAIIRVRPQTTRHTQDQESAASAGKPTLNERTLHDRPD